MRNNKPDVMWRSLAIIAVVVCGSTQYSNYKTQASNKETAKDIRGLIKEISEIKQSMVFVIEDHEEIKSIREKISEIERDLHHMKLERNAIQARGLRLDERD